MLLMKVACIGYSDQFTRVSVEFYVLHYHFFQNATVLPSESISPGLYVPRNQAHVYQGFQVSAFWFTRTPAKACHTILARLPRSAQKNGEFKKPHRGIDSSPSQHRPRHLHSSMVRP